MLALATHPRDRRAPVSKRLLAHASAVPTPWRTSAMIAAAVGRTVHQLGRSGSTRAVSGHAAAEMAAGRFVTTPTDESLLEAHLKGDEEAFTTLVDRYSVELVPFLTRLTGSRAAAEDVFQETFLQIHRSGHTFDLARRFRPWMYTIAVNKGRDWHRRNSRRKALSLSAPMGQGDGVSFVDLLASDIESPDSPLSTAEEASIVKRVVDSLPEHQREIILLSYFQQMSYNQIAETLRIPLGTVKSRLHSAIAAFARAWEVECGAGKDEAS
jgi:RNA polymerase sigma-70 factor (ECF subfamily)